MKTSLARLHSKGKALFSKHGTEGHKYYRLHFPEHYPARKQIQRRHFQYFLLALTIGFLIVTFLIVASMLLEAILVS